MRFALIVSLSLFIFFLTAARAQSNASFNFEGLNRIYVYYVPQGQMIMLQLPHTDGAVQMALLSIDGRLMQSKTIEYPRTSIQVSTEELQPGIYFVRICQKERQYHAKFVVD